MTDQDEELIHSPIPPGASGQDLPESADETEPTFSSEGTPAPKLDSPATILGRNSPAPFTLPPSSPVPSITFTPTPNFQARPRPRPRFGAYPSIPASVEESEESVGKESESRDDEGDLTEVPKEQERERTPTIQAPSRLRARFNADPVTPAPEWQSVEGSQTDDGEGDVTERARESTEERPALRYEDELATPAMRRKSFLLSVVNSTARPRMKMGTPLPPKIMEESISESSPETETDIVEATPAPGRGAAAAPPPVAATPAIKLMNALSGVTPRPRPRARSRLSHPLAQAWTSSRVSHSPPTALTASSHMPNGTPPLERASFISNASSHDLTTHARANASFDPVMGLAAQGHGVGRFNAGKLNSYLHGLNRRLQQENEGLLSELDRLREERANAQDASLLSTGSRTRRPRLSGGSVGSRRSSVGGITLGDVEEQGEEKVAFEEKLEELKREVNKLAGERDMIQQAYEDALLEREQLRKGLEEEHDQLISCQRALEEEEGARADAKEIYKERVRELEKGVEGVVKQLEDRATQAEAKADNAEKERDRVRRDLERMLADLEGERALATERAEKAEMAFESGRGIGSELKEANERVTQAMAELRSATAQIRDLEDEVMRADGKAGALDSELKEARETIRTLEGDLQTKWDELVDARAELEKSDKARTTTEEQLSKANACIAELEADAGAALGRIQTLEQKLLAAEDKFRVAEEVVEEAEDEVEKVKAEADRAHELARQMEEALEVAEKKMLEDEDRIADLKRQVVSLERDHDRSVSRVVPDHGAEIEALEAELDDAHREIARLTTRVNQSPARKAIEHAKDSKIEMLEREKEDLLERVKSLKNATANALSTPSKIANFSGISPAHRHVLNMTLRTPKTPGAPLRDVCNSLTSSLLSSADRL
jgi:predicted  nucleic acid-binding Zn-ribbon protein